MTTEDEYLRLRGINSSDASPTLTAEQFRRCIEESLFDKLTDPLSIEIVEISTSRLVSPGMIRIFAVVNGDDP